MHTARGAKSTKRQVSLLQLNGKLLKYINTAVTIGFSMLVESSVTTFLFYNQHFS